jgi:hypothetical protein
MTRVQLPKDAPDSEASRGVVLGPPSVDSLSLPEDISVRLHNQLHARQLFSMSDVRRRRQDVLGALMAALKVDVERVVQLYNDNP